MRWLVDGYNVIRREPGLSAREQVGLQVGRHALCQLLLAAARASGDQFTIVFDGTRGGVGRRSAVEGFALSSPRNRSKPITSSRGWPIPGSPLSRMTAMSVGRPIVRGRSPLPAMSFSLGSWHHPLPTRTKRTILILFRKKGTPGDFPRRPVPPSER